MKHNKHEFNKASSETENEYLVTLVRKTDIGSPVSQASAFKMELRDWITSNTGESSISAIKTAKPTGSGEQQVKIICTQNVMDKIATRFADDIEGILPVSGLDQQAVPAARAPRR